MTTYTAVIFPLESGFGNVAVIADDEDGMLTGKFALPAVPDTHPASFSEFEALCEFEDIAERVLAENGWRIAGFWNATADSLYAPAERI